MAPNSHDMTRRGRCAPESSGNSVIGGHGQAVIIQQPRPSCSGSIFGLRLTMKAPQNMIIRQSGGQAMQPVLSNLMAVVLLAHTILGCCWHSGVHRGVSAGANSGVAKASCCCISQRTNGQQTPSPCDCRSQCKASNYLPRTVTQIDRADESLLNICAPACIAATVFEFASMSVCDIAHVSCEAKPPLRLHLLNQILLI